ncbi:MAG: hypothetical protein ACI9TF_000189 [Paracrocinitomix sp.]|jgi:hypothetical protein
MTPAERINTYFTACGEGTAADIASHFTDHAVIFDTNVRPIRGAEQIGDMWVIVRQRWGGARWSVDSVIEGNATAAIEWSMTGTDATTQRQFAFRGSEHYRFAGSLIDEIRQYWTFDADTLDTGLVGFNYLDPDAVDTNG